MLGIGTVVYAATAAIGTLFKIPKRYLALGLGPLSGVIAYGADFLPGPAQNSWGWAFAALMGLLCTFGAQKVHDSGAVEKSVALAQKAAALVKRK